METKLNERRIEGVSRICGFLNGIEVSTNGSRQDLSGLEGVGYY